jgi:uncharacterized Rmd1/YagE family protein
MRCASYCLAKSFKLSALADFFKSQKYQVDLYRNVLQVSQQGKTSELFFFAHGTLVMWGLTSAEERQLLTTLRTFLPQVHDRPDYRHFLYEHGNKTRIYSHKRFQLEVIVLESEDSQIKLAISYGLAQSVKLEFYEDTVQRIIRENTPLFESLAKTGKVLLSKSDITRRMGEIFLTRSSVNLNSEYLDVPEYFWEYPNLETYYLISAHFLDIPVRVSALNQQLDVLHELFNMLNGQLQHQHASFLEIIIIVLIAMEILLTSLQMLWFH